LAQESASPVRQMSDLIAADPSLEVAELNDTLGDRDEAAISIELSVRALDGDARLLLLRSDPIRARG
jgi:hypothetical protein